MDLVSRQRIARWVIDRLQKDDEPSASEDARIHANAVGGDVAEIYTDRLEYWADKFVRREIQERYSKQRDEGVWR